MRIIVDVPDGDPPVRNVVLINDDALIDVHVDAASDIAFLELQHAAIALLASVEGVDPSLNSVAVQGGVPLFVRIAAPQWLPDGWTLTAVTSAP